MIPNGYDSIFTKLTDYPYEFEIDSSLRLASIDGIRIADNTNMISKEEYDKLLEDYHQLENNYNTATSSISSALNDIGVETDTSDTISSLSEKIRNIRIPHITKLAITGVGYQYSNIYHFNITQYANYKNLTLDNLSIQLNRTPFRNTQLSDLCGYLYYTFTYTPETGIITVTLTGTVNHQSWNDPAPSAIITIIE